MMACQTKVQVPGVVQVTSARAPSDYGGAEWCDLEKEVHQQDISEGDVQSGGYPLISSLAQTGRRSSTCKTSLSTSV